MHTRNSTLKVAVVHDWLTGMRGGEKVLAAILELFPQAELFTLFYRPGKLNAQIENRKIHTSFLNRLPFCYRYYRYLLPLFPFAIEQFDLSGFDLVISSSHCVAKGVLPAPHATHICYMHSPMRYIWDKRNDYFRAPWIRFLVTPFLHRLRLWDTTSSSRVDFFIANSHWIQTKIKKFFRRDAHVIHPFFDAQGFFPQSGDRGDYYLVASAFAPYKRIDLAIKACEQLKRTLFVVGDGQHDHELRALAGKHTHFLGHQDSTALRDLMAGAKALLFPGEEDFGIVPIEAMACGTPVIAYGRGGALETVISGQTGLFFTEPTVESLAETLLQFESMPALWREPCIRRAAHFSKERFQKNLISFINGAAGASSLLEKSHQPLHPLS